MTMMHYYYYYYYYIFIKYRSDGQVVIAEQTEVLTARVRTSLVTPDCRFSLQCKVIALLALFDAITGPTEFISLVNSVKMVNMP